MKARPKDGVLVALIVVLCASIVVSLVVLDRYDQTWMALVVYACLYVAIALAERRSRRQ